MIAFLRALPFAAIVILPFAATAAEESGKRPGPADRESPSQACESRAVAHNGKPLTGAAKVSFMKKCEAEMRASSGCEARAIDKNGKPLAGAARNAFIKKCEADVAEVK